MTSSSRVDFGCDPNDHGTDTGIFKRQQLKKLWTVSLTIILCLTSRKTLDFGADPDHDADLEEFLTEFLPLRDRSNCKNFASNSIKNDYRAELGVMSCRGGCLLSRRLLLCDYYHAVSVPTALCQPGCSVRTFKKTTVHVQILCVSFAWQVYPKTSWNSLPAQLRLGVSLPTFKKRLKPLLFTGTF